MRMCADHWQRLRTAIDARGLGHLVAANGRDAVARLKSELEGQDEADDFEPLMYAHNLIWGRALEMFGLAIMGDYCPACELIQKLPPPPEGHRYKTNEEFFIDGPADAALSSAVAAGLMP